MYKLRFLAEYFKHFRVTGAVMPSSLSLCKKMTKYIDFSSANVIVELGSGTGVLTQLLLKKMHKDAVLYSFEVNDSFCKILNKIEDPRLKVIHASAENIQHFISETDYVVSGLPLVSLPKDVGDAGCP